MNWLSPVQRVIGSFWHNHMDEDFLLGIENCHALISSIWEARISNYQSSLLASSDVCAQENLPQLFLLRSDTVRKQYTDIFAVFAGTAEIEEPVANNMWRADAVTQCKSPLMLSDSPVECGRLFMEGLDFTYADGAVCFYTDPAALSLPMVTLTAADGTLSAYYRLWAWDKNALAYKDRFSGLLGNKCDPEITRCWEMHQKGASVLRVKTLLASAGNAVIASADGAVHDIWEEQGIRYMLVGDVLYSADASAAVGKESGDNVSAGDVLFGYFKFYTGQDVPSSEDVPGMPVMTDAGKLVASNATLSAYTVSGQKVLPLVGDAAVLDAYKTLSATRAADTTIPFAEVPASVNPFQFVHNTLRRHSGGVALLEGASLDKAIPVMDRLRQDICASCILHVYVKAEGESVGIGSADFIQDCGNLAVAGSADIQLIAAWSEAERVGA